MPKTPPVSPSLPLLEIADPPEKSASERVSGLCLERDWITPAEEENLLTTIDALPWSSDLKRRVQHYGIRYDYQRRGLMSEGELEPLPAWLSAISTRLVGEAKVALPMQQAIVNEYEPGQGISKHVDNSCFDAPIVSLSLGSACEMRFEHTENETSEAIILLPRSLLIMDGDARWTWRHSIPARQSDRIDGIARKRGRRVSITFRRLRHTKLGSVHENNIQR